VDICPVNALQFCDDKASLALLNRGGRYQICKIG
jgi:hypothetical protein